MAMPKSGVEFLILGYLVGKYRIFSYLTALFVKLYFEVIGRGDICVVRDVPVTPVSGMALLVQ